MDAIELIHERAVKISGEFHKKESELLGVLVEVIREKVYEKKGYVYLLDYCRHALGLSEDIALTFMSIARKSIEVPKIKTLIDEGKIHTTNAKKVSRVLNQSNQELWLEKAEALSSRELEKEIARLEPDKAKKEFIKPITKTTSRMILDMGQDVEDLLRHVQDLLSKKFQKAVTLEETLKYLGEDFVRRHDPVIKAQRNANKTLSSGAPVARQVAKQARSARPRTPIPASVLHAVNLRDQGRCTGKDPQGNRCAHDRWTEVHHIVTLASGGKHELENLTTLCSAHHRAHHQAQPVLDHLRSAKFAGLP
jgi:5-methylcytosine-specific restriction endonuclease McrA